MAMIFNSIGKITDAIADTTVEAARQAPAATRGAGELLSGAKYLAVQLLGSMADDVVVNRIEDAKDAKMNAMLRNDERVRELSARAYTPERIASGMGMPLKEVEAILASVTQ